MSAPDVLVPHIPEDAPFAPAQRAWLNGFLAGLYSYAPPPAAADMQKSPRVALLYGSQTGTAESLSRKLLKELKAAGLDVTLSSLEGYVPATLAAETRAVFIVSTYGEGEPPDSAQAFYQQLCVERFPLLGNLSYALLALGDSHYEHFCHFGKDLDAKLSALGATRILDRVDCDVELDAAYATWKTAVGRRLRELAIQQLPPALVSVESTSPTAPVVAVPPSASAAPGCTRDKPYLASVAEKRALTHPSSSKLTLHLSFEIAASSVRYEAGDACGVIPQNSPDLVDTILGLLPFAGSELVEIPMAGLLPVRQALLEKLAITRLTRNMVTQYAAIAQCSRLQSLLMPERQEELDRYLHGRDLVDLLKECPGALETPGDLVKMLGRLVPRLYSISSSPSAHPGQIHTTVSVVRYRTHHRERQGVCSALLADRVEVGDSVPLYIHPNKKFRLPQDPRASVIMIGPGTGIAPFRAFLHERRATGASGQNWLFFGERSAATDFLYREELESMLGDRHLTQLDTAFSRDQEKKVYVQDLMMQKAAQLWAWLQQGAFVYVCGDASRMAKDVDRTLCRIAQEQGDMSLDVAELYMQALKGDHRYQRDIY